MVHKKSIFRLIGYFESKLTADADYGNGVLKENLKIVFDTNMIVYHQYKIKLLY
jgi:hypothetical protein